MLDSELFTKELNGPQADAVQTLDGPLLILAGAGSGKTRVLTYRIANLIIQGRAAPSQIMAVTFTNKAARSMEGRSLDLLRRFQIPVYERLWISTFHSTCVRLLREHVNRLGFQPFFGIYDQSDQLNVIKKVVESLGLNEKIYPPKTFQAFINDAKMKALTPEKMSMRSLNFIEEKGLDVYRKYEDEMRKSNAMDFGDLLLKTYILWSEHPDVLKGYQEKFSYVMVDEYQDTNHIQYLLVQLLAKHHQNLCVVGDEDQSIYSWRGADITNILNFEKDFPNAKVIKLEENYRSTETIVKAASHVIMNNTQRKEKTLFTNNGVGDKIQIREETNEYEEARFVARKVLELLPRARHGLRDFAIFYRTNAQSRVLEEQLRSNTIPYKIVGGVKFYERMEIKDLLAYLRLIINPKDDIAVARIINTPVRGIGKTTLEKLENYSVRNGVGIIESIPRMILEGTFNTSTAKKLEGFIRTLNEMRDQTQDLKPSAIYHTVLDLTGYVTHLKEQDSQEADARIENLEELDNAITQFEKERGDEATLQAFLEEIALVSDVDQMNEDEASVTMMTLHISKGLEYPFVFIVGMEDGIFPSGRSFESSDPTDLEEERRLAYVGMTRAEVQLFLTHARTRKVWGVDQHNPPSRFLGEIPREYVQVSTALAQPAFMKRYQDRFGESEGTSDSANDWSRSGSDFRSGWDRNRYDSSSSATDGDVQSFPDEDFYQGAGGYAKGMRVKHPTFGVGTVFKLEGAGDDQKVSILFQNNILKKFVVKYARLERLS